MLSFITRHLTGLSQKPLSHWNSRWKTTAIPLVNPQKCFFSMAITTTFWVEIRSGFHSDFHSDFHPSSGAKLQPSFHPSSPIWIPVFIPSLKKIPALYPPPLIQVEEAHEARVENTRSLRTFFFVMQWLHHVWILDACSCKAVSALRSENHCSL